MRNMRLKNISILSSALARKRNRQTPMDQQTGAVEKINYTASIRDTTQNAYTRLKYKLGLMLI
jgi:hypothetical protein